MSRLRWSLMLLLAACGGPTDPATGWPVEWAACGVDADCTHVLGACMCNSCPVHRGHADEASRYEQARQAMDDALPDICDAHHLFCVRGRCEERWRDVPSSDMFESSISASRGASRAIAIAASQSGGQPREVAGEWGRSIQ